MNSIYAKWESYSLVLRIFLGLLIGVALALLVPQLSFISIFGVVFVSALKAVAPILVLFLVTSAITQHKKGQKTNIKDVLFLYLIGTFLAALTAVIFSFAVPTTLTLDTASTSEIAPPQGVAEVLMGLVLDIVSNPIDALATANYIGILSWAVVLGLTLKNASESTKTIISDISDSLTQIVKYVISFAPFGIMGLVFDSITNNGLESLLGYAQLIIVLVSAMAFVALIMNPFIVYLKIKQNPYPLVFKCLKDSGITAFFTRSSAANIPVNMQLAEDLHLDKDTYSVSIPLGSTINMAGAAITITTLSLAAAYTLGIEVSFMMALILSLLASISACGSSGVAGGSLLLVPIGCSLFGIPADIAMQVVGVGFVISIVQDSCETALNSSTDILFTAAADIAAKQKEGQTIDVSQLVKKK